jgi:general secretion pathway protein D
VVKAILGELLQESYVIAPGVGGTVTFSTAKPVNKDQAFAILEMLLSWNNAALVFTNGRYSVVPIAQAVQGLQVPRVGEAERVRGFSVRAFPLKYVAPGEMEKLLQPYARPGAIVRADTARSMIIMAGNQQELANYAQTIEIFDVDWLEGMSVGMFRLERVEVAKVVPELQAVFGEQSGSPLAGMFRFVPIERLNSVMVITPQQDYLEKAREWLEKLDRGGDSAGTRLYVYDVKNVKATDLAEQLSEIFSGGSGGQQRSGGVPAASGSVAPGMKPVELSSLNQPGGPAGGALAAAAPAGNASSGGDGLALAGGDEIKITAVEENNALLIRASPAQYEAVLGAIRRLDTIPLQVHIEAKVVEVSLTDDLRYGVSSFLEGAIATNTGANGGGGGRCFGLPLPANFPATAPCPQRTAIRMGSGGLNYLFSNGLELAGIVDLLQSVGNTRVISSPSLVVLNNKEAKINVGQQIPITTFFNSGINTGQIPGQIAQTQGSVQYLQTGTTLTITPRVNPGGLVFMEVSQEVSAPGPVPAGGSNPPVSTRTVDTEVAVQSGETVLLGGLIRQDESESKGGVPGLSQIPILGAVFGSHNNTSSRTELLVLIKPTVIRNSEEATEVTEEYRKRFQGLKPLDLK